jgi:muramoyltetrapeptide carboxypeptidase
VELGDHVGDAYGYLAGTDAARLSDLNDAFADPGVKGVFAARGGYGTQRIVDRLELGPLRRRPRVVVGFSDITALQLHLWRRLRLVTFYGPMMQWSDERTGPAEAESLRSAIMSDTPITLVSDPAEPSAAVHVPGPVVSGPLIGGNLTMIQTSLSTGDLPDLRGAILLFEDVDEDPYSYDRMLTQLRRAGSLDRLAGIAIGQFLNAQGLPGEWTAAEAVHDRVADLGVPVLGGLRVGHGRGQLTVPLGSHATLDTGARTLRIQPGVQTSPI